MINTRAGLLFVLMSPFAAALEPSASDDPCKGCDRREAVAVFTGRYVDGLPVYRLPPVNVIASRKTEVAKIGRDVRPSANSATRPGRG
jgi:hypothetical protein